MDERIQKLQFTGEFITMQQWLQMAGIIQSGGQAKMYLSELKVEVNGIQDQRRGRKLRNGDIIEIPGIIRCQLERS